MAQQVQVQVFSTCYYCPPPQYVSLRRIGILNQLKCATIPSLSVSASSVLRNASFCCTSSVPCNLPSSPKIFVKGLPLSTSEGHLMKVFSEFGEVTLIQLPIDKESGQSLGFAYIWFVKEESAQLAVLEMNGKFFYGRFIYVTIAKPGSSKSSKRATAYKF
ncbi:hypothetical protein AAZX31_17G017200 [Glycine max]|uniref:RRM domain-containing protein n=1 Tax=Glycine max TaxID=3847 RepID=A0A0R0FIB0_SOYBN|nr:RNA recognition motif-containing protein [Glycine max]XP_028209563.1 glycine-rich RNA-binding protein 4, mitochondrial-like isoform X1 [Glycine soja]KAG4929252.1 hypothetical protein JHK86_046213 [Glycine max]KAG5096461.1 hypothetical protein JHK82_046315 [Glycine max]KAG5101256.1 hypothetical protein JHK84_046225 [Glycine max]KAH1116271.1 hypothetical protein GYH30_045947 [Glycine max]KRH02127.1 hypothetical protein GLYMA_17G017500v4 [Glycine max]|eukprot:XP_003550050.1 glycine-rich RNA-binding protein 4, mitochondrial isoform X1 [Glycine max]